MENESQTETVKAYCKMAMPGELSSPAGQGYDPGITVGVHLNQPVCCLFTFLKGTGTGPLIALTAVCLSHQFRQLDKQTSAEQVIDQGCQQLFAIQAARYSELAFFLKVLTHPSLWSDYCHYPFGFSAVSSIV